MAGALNAFAFGLALTAIFAFRFSTRRPVVLAAYFVAFTGIEWAAQALLLPEGAIPPATAYVLFALAGLFTVANLVRYRLEATDE